jgi:endonuclease/exonuclease/phosphatase family metal-dependent hydrolase
MITRTLAHLPPVDPRMRQDILDAPRKEESHIKLLSALPALNAVQQGGEAAKDVLGDTVTVVAWNVERCLFPEASAAHLTDIAPDVVMLSEVDHGMARTGQRHTTERVADATGMTYVFGVEFYEMGLGGRTERAFCTDEFNALGWHGNAILSSVPITRAAMVRLDAQGHWFAGPQADPGQPRIGGRMALLAEVPTSRGPLTVVSTHLESNATAPFRHTQFKALLDAIDHFAPDMPVLIGGDLNTGNHMPPDFDWQKESLFELAEDQGYDWRFTADGMTTRPSLITPHPDRKMKLDWIAGRGLRAGNTGIHASLDTTGRPLSDHDAVWACAVMPE